MWGMLGGPSASMVGLVYDGAGPAAATAALSAGSSPVCKRARASPARPRDLPEPSCNTKGYSSTYLAMRFANVRAGTWYPPEH